MSTTQQGTATARLRLALSALLGKPVETDEDAEKQVTERMQALSRDLETTRGELAPAKSFVTILSAELGGETDPAKAAVVIRQLRAAVEAAKESSATSAKTAAESAAETILLKHEAKLGSKPLRDHFKAELVKELSAGKAAGTTATEQLLAAMPAASNLGQKAGGDTGANASADFDTRVSLRADALLEENPRLKALAANDYSAALVEAINLAGREIRAGAGGASATQ